LITIRRATLADVKRLVPLWQEMMSFHAQLDPRFRPAFDGAQYWAQNLKSWLRDENYCVLVAEAEGELVGYIIGSVRERIPVFTPAIYGFVSDICVASHMRRQGIGTRLFATLKEWFRNAISSFPWLIAIPSPELSGAKWASRITCTICGAR